jgi:hypothetical protein
MTFDLDKVTRAVDLLIKLEIHAFALLLVGAGLVLHGQKEEGQLVLGGALAVFRGKQSSGS